MKYVITGGAGFIGSNLAEELINQEQEVVLIDNLCTGRASNLDDFKDRITFLKGDVRELDFLKQAFKGADYVLHFAALISVVESDEQPGLYKEVNEQGTENVLKAALHNNVKKVVVPSSCAVYGDSQIPMSEKLEPKPVSVYAENKLRAERLCREYYDNHELKTMVLRFFNVFGPKQDPCSAYAGVISLFIRKLMNDEQPVIYGDGEQTRDFVYVKDVVRACMLALEAEQGFGEPINIGSGKETSVNHLLETINRILGKEIKPKYAPERKGELRNAKADIRKAERILGYKNMYSFEKGLKETFEWFRRNRL